MDRELSISRHAIVRYFNRIDKSYAVTDNSFDLWQKAHKSEADEAEKRIRELYEDDLTIWISSGNYNNHRKADYYLNKKERIVFVVAENKLITLYVVDYGLDDLGNAQMLSVLLNNLERAYNQQDTYIEHKAPELKKIKFDDDLLNRELEEIRAKEKLILAQKEELKSKKKRIESKQAELTSRIESIREKIVKSVKALEV